jgi:hypothetical protein
MDKSRNPVIPKINSLLGWLAIQLICHSITNSSIDLWRWYINITITILDIIHRPVFYIEHGVQFQKRWVLNKRQDDG